MKSSSVAIFLKQVTSVLSSVTKSKSSAIKSKAEALKARLMIFSLLKSKRLPLAAISHKVHAILGVGPHQHDDDDSKANQSQPSSSHVDHLNTDGDDYYNSSYYYYYNNDDNGDDGKYPDLRHCLFDEEEEEEELKLELGDDPNASVIDMVKNSMEKEGEDFKLEDEIDHVADIFINKFHKRMKLQKLESFKRYKQMLARGAD